MKTSLRIIERCAAEPFRLFFPLGLLASACGVILWPALSQGWLDYYPLEAHARWMAIGFGGCFIAGFLGTAGPRLLDAPPWSKWELLLFVGLALAMMVCLGLNEIAFADALAGIWLLGVLGSLLFRFFKIRGDVPPPGMPMAALGLFSAGVAGIVLGLTPLIEIPYCLYSFSRLLYFQGLVWLPVIAVAPFLLPRFFGKSSLHSFDDSPEIPAGWTRRFTESLAAGLLLIATFACEAWFSPRLGMALRAIVVFLYLAVSVPGLVGWTKTNGLGIALRWVAPCAAGGWLLAVVFPLHRTGMLHLMFIGGIGLLILSAATRVILGHAERQDRLKLPMKWFHAMWALLLFTAATRMTSDFLPEVRMTHFTYAAILWLAILVFWMWKMRRELKHPLPQPLAHFKSPFVR